VSRVSIIVLIPYSFSLLILNIYQGDTEHLSIMRSSCILFHLFALVSFAVDVTYAISPAPIKDRQNDNGGENEVRYPSVSNKPTHNSHGRKLVPRRRRTKSAKHPKATKAKDNCSCDDETSSSNELTCVELADSMGMKISLRHRRLEPITLSVIVIFAAKAIATAVLAKAAGEGFGWVMNQVGITDKALTAEDVAKVSKMVAKVDKDIEFLRMEVAAGFATMRDEFDLTRAAISQTQLTSATTSVQAMFDTYKSYLGLFNFKPSAEDNEEVRNMVKTLQTKIISSDTGIRYHVHLIHNVLMGPGLFSGESLLSTYSRLAMQNSDCTYKYSKYMNDFLEYYISYQTIGLFLMVEAYNAFDSSTREVLQRDYYSDWRGMINLQMKWVNNISPMATFVEGPYNLGVISGRVTSLAIRGNQILALSVHGTLTIKSMDNQSARPLKELGNTFLSTFIGIHDTRNSGKVIVASSGSYQGKSVIKVGIFPTYRGSPLGDSPPYSQSHHSKGALGIDGIYALSYHLDKSTGFLYFLEIGGIRNPGMRTLTLSRVNTGRGGVNQYIERVAYLDFGGSWMLPMLQGKEHVWALGMVGRYSVIMCK